MFFKLKQPELRSLKLLFFRDQVLDRTMYFHTEAMSHTWLFEYLVKLIKIKYN